MSLKEEQEQFPLYFKKRDFLNSDDLNELKKLVNLENTIYEDSKIYNIAKAENELEPTERKSARYEIKDESIVNSVNQLVIRKLNGFTENMQFNATGKTVEIIKYEKGGYFKAHQDFVFLISNQIKCYALLLCLDCDCKGGKTVMYWDKDKVNKTEFEETVIPGGMIVFRNEILHEGLPVLEGHKIILKIDLLGRKNEQIVTIGFTKDDKTYEIPLKNIKAFKNNFLLGCLTFNEKTKKENKYSINIDKYTLEEFLPVYQLLTSQEDLGIKFHKENEDILDFFGLNMDLHKNLYSYYDNIYASRINELELFMKSTEEPKLYYVENIEQYHIFRKYFRMEKNILPVQWLFGDGDHFEGTKIYMISIAGVPIWCDPCKDYGEKISICQFKPDDIELGKYKMLKYLFNYIYDNKACVDLRYICKKCKAKKIPQPNKSFTQKHIIACNNVKNKEFCQKILDLDEIDLNVMIMQGLFHYHDISNKRENNDGYLIDLKYLLENHNDYYAKWDSNKKKVNFENKNTYPFTIDELLAIVPKISDFLKDNLKIEKNNKILTDRTKGYYYCNQHDYYEKNLHLGLGFINAC